MPESPSAGAAADPLASWNEGATKRSIMDFVARVTEAGGKDYVAPESASRRSTTTARYGPNGPIIFRLRSPLIR